MAGPGIKRDERIYGASLIDIAPTVLTLFDLAVGADTDGRPLLEAWEVPPKIEVIPSWDGRAGEAGTHNGTRELDREQTNELMQQFAALGYIEDPGTDQEKAADSADLESKYNVARTLLWKIALIMMQKMRVRSRDFPRCIIRLATPSGPAPSAGNRDGFSKPQRSESFHRRLQREALRFAGHSPARRRPPDSFARTARSQTG
jgi:hypothetical protein